jgi:hypothetical protein
MSRSHRGSCLVWSIMLLIASHSCLECFILSWSHRRKLYQSSWKCLQPDRMIFSVFRLLLVSFLNGSSFFLNQFKFFPLASEGKTFSLHWCLVALIRLNLTISSPTVWSSIDYRSDSNLSKVGFFWTRPSFMILFKKLVMDYNYSRS